MYLYSYVFKYFTNDTRKVSKDGRLSIPVYYTEALLRIMLLKKLLIVSFKLSSSNKYHK